MDCAGKIVAYTGAHGTGKTTAAHERMVRLKRENPGLSIGFLAETAAECPFPINQEASHAAQMWIFSTQVSRELTMARIFDLVVSDRTALDAAAYTLVRGWEETAGAMADLVRAHAGIYREIHFLRGEHLHADGLRDTDRAWRAQVDTALYGLFRWTGLADDPRFSVEAA
ncbi:MAG: hypothetical protein ABIJ95_02375 [Pseudomonadota bacterium]